MFWMSDNSGFQVITYNLYRRAFKEFKHMYITIQPVRLIHRRCSFNVCILTIRKFTLVFLNIKKTSLKMYLKDKIFHETQFKGS